MKYDHIEFKKFTLSKIPKFQHDCTNCTYLGTLEKDDEVYDCYHCALNQTMPSLIARFSSDGPDYCSMPPEYIKSEDGRTPLALAKRLLELS